MVRRGLAEAIHIVIGLRPIMSEVNAKGIGVRWRGCPESHRTRRSASARKDVPDIQWEHYGRLLGTHRPDRYSIYTQPYEALRNPSVRRRLG